MAKIGYRRRGRAKSASRRSGSRGRVQSWRRSRSAGRRRPKRTSRVQQTRKMRSLATKAATKVVKHMSEKKMTRVEQPFRYPHDEHTRVLNIWAQGPISQLKDQQVKKQDGWTDHYDFGYHWLKGYSPYAMTTPMYLPKTVFAYSIMDWICNKPNESVWLSHEAQWNDDDFDKEDKLWPVDRLPQWGYGTREGRQINVTSLVFEGYFRGNAGKFRKNIGDNDIYYDGLFPNFYNVVPPTMGQQKTKYRFVCFETYQPLDWQMKHPNDFHGRNLKRAEDTAHYRLQYGESTTPVVHGIFEDETNDPNYAAADHHAGYIKARQDDSTALMFHNRQPGNVTWMYDKFNRKVVKSVYADEIISVGYKKIPKNGWDGSTRMQAHDHNFTLPENPGDAAAEALEALVEGDHLTTASVPVHSLQGLSRWVGDEKRFRKEIRFPDGGLKVTYDAETDSWLPGCSNRNIYIAIVTDMGINPLGYHSVNGQTSVKGHLHKDHDADTVGATGLEFYAKTHMDLTMKINYRDF